MTKKFIGEFSFEDNKISLTVSEDPIPDKQKWHNHMIWEFNGKRYRPVTQKAAESLDNLVKTIAAAGYVGATKPGKRKPTSVKYAVCTYGVEDFTLIK